MNRVLPLGRGVLILAILWGAVGCGGSVRLVDPFKERQAEGDYAWIAEQPVDCTPDEAGCNQLHLIQGDACFRLAERAAQDGNDTEAATHYACAASALAAGIAQTTDWSVAGGEPAPWYANWCEALREQRDAATGTTADQLNTALQKAAQAFAEAVPAHPAAVYYRINAQLAASRPQLLDPEGHPGLCADLTAMHAELVAVAPRADGTPYAAPVQQLTRELELARNAVPGCS